MDVNIGRVEAEPGQLKGNVLDSMEDRESLVLTTNWIKKPIAKAGLASGDRLVLTTGDTETEIFYFPEIPSQDKLSKGGGILTFNPQFGDTAVIIFFRTDFSRFRKLAPLSLLQIRKK